MKIGFKEQMIYNFFNNDYRYIDFKNIDCTNIEDHSYLFKNFKIIETIKNIDHLNQSSIVNAEAMFMNCEKLTGINLILLDLKELKNAEMMFMNCRNLRSIDLRNINFKKLEKVENMFRNCENLTPEKIVGIDMLLECKAFKKLSKEDQMNVFKGTKIDVEKELKKLNKKKKER